MRLFLILLSLFIFCPAVMADPGNGNGYGHCKHERSKHSHQGKGHEAYDDKECPSEGSDDQSEDPLDEGSDDNQGGDNNTTNNNTTNNNTTTTNNTDNSTTDNSTTTNTTNVDNSTTTVDNSINTVINNPTPIVWHETLIYVIHETLPIQKPACTSKRKFVFTLGTTRKINQMLFLTEGGTFKFFNKKGKTKVAVDYTGLSKSHYAIKVWVQLKSGREIEYTRFFWTCTPKKTSWNTYIIF